jgi:hypothetical protein
MLSDCWRQNTATRHCAFENGAGVEPTIGYRAFDLQRTARLCDVVRGQSWIELYLAAMNRVEASGAEGIASQGSRNFSVTYES